MNFPPGPNFRIEAEPAQLSATGHAPELILRG
jgi:hypothetical protein